MRFLRVTALVPGLDADDLSIEVLNNTVSLRGEFKSTEIEDAKYLVSELPAGRFARVITLPTVLDAARPKLISTTACFTCAFLKLSHIARKPSSFSRVRYPFTMLSDGLPEDTQTTICFFIDISKGISPASGG